MKDKKKTIWSACVFLVIAGLTFLVIFRENNPASIWRAVKEMELKYLISAVLIALFFVSAEGILIWYLLRSVDKRARLWRCIRYSFIGFFFSGITPSATGGQPIQLYYMNKDGFRIGDSSVVLMAVATAYKFVLVVIGIGILLIWKKGLTGYLGNYVYLYYLGLFLNAILVVVLFLLMCRGEWIGKIYKKIDAIFIFLHIWKPSEKRGEKIQTIVMQYQSTAALFRQQKRKMAFVVGFTLLQRCSVFFMTYLIYLGFHLSGSGVLVIMALQAAVYIAVDMLPLPGSQGITELMYQAVFASVFSGGQLIASMCVTRGVGFYFLLLVSGMICMVCSFEQKRRDKLCIKGGVCYNPNE